MIRYILTGTPGAGKTAVLRLLELGGATVVEEAATDVIALENARGHREPWHDRCFIDKIVRLQQRRQALARVTEETAAIFFDRSPVCTLALSRYLGYAPSRLLEDEVERVVRDNVYAETVFFLLNQGSIQTTAARQMSFEDSLNLEQLHRRTYRDLGSNSPKCRPPLWATVSHWSSRPLSGCTVDCIERDHLVAAGRVRRVPLSDPRPGRADLPVELRRHT